MVLFFLTTIGGYPPFHFNWSNGSNAAYLENLPAGRYCVTATDGSCCENRKCFQVNQNGVIEIRGVQNSTTQSSCNGAIDLVAEGGAFTFQWSNGATTANSVFEGEN